MGSLNDMHCHLGFAADGQALAAAGLEAGALMLSCGVVPEAWGAERAAFAEFSNVICGFGVHPWYIRDGALQADALRAMLDQGQPRVLGEVGLDFSKRHRANADDQRAVFETLTTWAAHVGGRLLSIHAVDAADEALEILETSGALESCTCIFHWFSGSSSALKRAINDGCYFSCGPRMAATGRGREYLKAIPLARLLLETDMPSVPGESCTYAAMHEALAETASCIADLKGPEALDALNDNSRNIFSLAS